MKTLSCIPLQPDRETTALSDDFMAALCALLMAGQHPEVAELHRTLGILSKGPVLNGPLSDLTYLPKSYSPGTLEEAERSHILRMLQQTGGVAAENGVLVSQIRRQRRRI
jgi:hypothetical protein